MITKTLKTEISVELGMAPNGEKLWQIIYDKHLVKDKSIGTGVEKWYIDKILPETDTNEEYWMEVAKYCCTMLEEKLINKEDIFQFTFNCTGQCYRKTK